jgi:hypothetical protein
LRFAICDLRFPLRGGFTLAEILVALSVFMVLGSMLILSLSAGVDTWRTTEDRRVLYAEAQTILGQIERDLVALAAPRPGEPGEPAARFLCDFDANNRPRLRFVRTLKGEDSDEAMRTAGTTPSAKAEAYDFKGESKKNLLPLGGLMEVAYFMDPDPQSNVLHRAVRAPAGGPGSLFVDKNISTKEKAAAVASPVADGILYLGFHLWTQHTTTWDLRTPLSAQIGSACGPEITWDSTRGVLPPDSPSAKGNPNVFWLAAGEASLQDPADDVFPGQVRILLCVAAGGGAPHSMLERDISKRDRLIPVGSAAGFPGDEEPDVFRYVRIGTEWVHYKSHTSVLFEADSDGRGARGTSPQAHVAGEEIWGGRTFLFTVRIPSEREFWAGPEMSRMLARHAPPDPAWMARVKKGTAEDKGKKKESKPGGR